MSTLFVLKTFYCAWTSLYHIYTFRF